MENLIDIVSNQLLTTLWLAPLLALFAGLLTSITPCALTSIPLLIGYISGSGDNNTKMALRLSLVFSFGSAITYITLGILAALVGSLFHHLGSWWHILLGVVMIIMTLQVLEVINIIPHSFSVATNKRRGYLGAMLAGLLGGLFASHCALPVIIILMAIVAEQGNILMGITLFLLYAVGHSVVIVIAGTWVGWLKRMTANPKYITLARTIKVVISSVVLVLAFHMFYLAFNPVNHLH